MYLLVNRDNSINYAGEHPIDTRLQLEGLTVLEFATRNKAEVLTDIPVEEAMWDTHTQTVTRVNSSRPTTETLE